MAESIIKGNGINVNPDEPYVVPESSIEYPGGAADLFEESYKQGFVC